MKNLIQHNFCLKQLNWWKVGGRAEYFAAPKSELELIAVLEKARDHHWPVKVLGGGSNVLIGEQGVKGLVLHMSGLSGVRALTRVHPSKCLRPSDEGHTRADVRSSKYESFEQGSAPVSAVCADRPVVASGDAPTDLPVFRACVGAGASKSQLARLFLERKLMPAVFLTGLPGDVGGGVVMNAGVGENIKPREFCEIVEWVRVLHYPSLKEYRLSREQIDWTYRKSQIRCLLQKEAQASLSRQEKQTEDRQNTPSQQIDNRFAARKQVNGGQVDGGQANGRQVDGEQVDGGQKNLGELNDSTCVQDKFSWAHYIILQVGVVWPYEPRQEVMQLVRQATKNRVRRQPLRYPSGGSTFKNPLPQKAGQLIEQCGLKGFRCGGARVSEQHANFIVNDHGATADDIAYIVKHVQHTVQQKTGITLQPEFVHF